MFSCHTHEDRGVVTLLQHLVVGERLALVRVVNFALELSHILTFLEHTRKLKRLAWLHGKRQVLHVVNHVIFRIEQLELGDLQVLEPDFAESLDDLPFNFSVLINKTKVPQTSDGTLFYKFYARATANPESVNAG